MPGRSTRALGNEADVLTWLSRPSVKAGAGVVASTALAAWFYNVEVAVVTASAFVLAWFAWFHGTRAIVAIVKGGRPNVSTVIGGSIGIAGCVALGLTKFAPVLIIPLGMYFLIDALVLRFKG